MSSLEKQAKTYNCINCGGIGFLYIPDDKKYKPSDNICPECKGSGKISVVRLEVAQQKIRELQKVMIEEVDACDDKINDLETRLNQARQLAIALMVKLDFIGAVEEAREEEKKQLLKLQQTFDEIFPKRLVKEVIDK